MKILIILRENYKIKLKVNKSFIKTLFNCIKNYKKWGSTKLKEKNSINKYFKNSINKYNLRILNLVNRIHIKN